MTNNCLRIILIAYLNKYINLNDNNIELGKLNCFIIASLLDGIQSCSNKYKKKCMLMLMCANECKNGMLENIAQIYMEHVIQIKRDNNDFLTDIDNILNVYL